MLNRCFFGFTGIDGSGKTTQARLLTERLQQDNIEVLYIRNKWEPFFIRPLIRTWKDKRAKRKTDVNGSSLDMKNHKQKLLNNPFLRWMWLVAFFIDYGLQSFFKIRIKLFGARLIVSDRIFCDSVIDQAVNLGDKNRWLLQNLDSLWMKILFPRPDIVFYVDCPEQIAFSRKRDEYTPDIDYLIDRRRLYLSLADKYKWTVLDGTLPVSQLADEIRNTAYKRLRGQCV